ncbi:MAG: terpene cyclase/mutase family protein [Planctomycetes bacterium]|nr:terpene cyclase/mutase family protein [Planctomycetota bacterium]
MDSDDPQPAEESPLAEQPPENAERGDQRSRYTGVIAWTVSGALHATMAMLLGTIYFLTAEQEEEVPPVRVQTLPPPPEKREDRHEDTRELLDPKVQLDLASSDDTSPVSQLDLPQEDSQHEEQEENPIPKGREEAVADSESGGSGAFMAIGAGGGAAGMFGSRSGGGKRRAVAKGGGSKGSEGAVDAALRWFKRHQAADGAWRAISYQNNCTMDGPKCEPGKNHRNGENEDIALTALATLCFLGAGYDHATPNTHRQVVRKAVDWLLAAQGPDGVFGKAYNYEQAIAAMALAEAFAMTSDRSLRPAAQRAIDVVLARRAQPTALIGSGAGGTYPVTGLGWGDFTATGQKAHSSACGWNIQAIKSAATAGLDVKDGPAGAKLWLDAVWRGTCALEKKDPARLDPYRDTTTLAYYVDFTTGAASELGAANVIHNLAAVGVVSGVFMGVDASSVMIQTMANHVMAYDVPRAWPGNLYYTYYCTFGMFQLGGDRWQTWNNIVRDQFVASQRTEDGCFDGSWDFERCTFYAHDVGRLLSTALSCLSLEVYYRYAQVHPHDAKNGKAAR